MNKKIIMSLIAGVMATTPVCGQTNTPEKFEFRTDINPALIYFQAYQQLPQLTEAENKQLFENSSWPAERVDESSVEILKKFDNSFKLVRRARYSKVPCDWGYDLSDGPEALLGGLAPAKQIALAARVRASAALDRNDFGSLLADVSATHALGRNLATDRILISAIVQFAIENILATIIQENYYRLSAEQLDRLMTALDQSPARGTIAATLPTEEPAFYGYILRKVEAMADRAKGDEAKFWSEFSVFWTNINTDPSSGEGPDPTPEQFKQLAKGSSAEVLRLLREMPAMYEEVTRVMLLPYVDYKNQIGTLTHSINNSPNPFIKQLFRVFDNVRGREFQTILRHEMLRAAVAYKRGGLNGFQQVQNPLVGGPFEFSKFVFEGEERGFKIRSTEAARDHDEVMIFLEKPGKAVHLVGKNAGEAR